MKKHVESFVNGESLNEADGGAGVPVQRHHRDPGTILTALSDLR